jgi:hypothetical protein
MLGSIILIAAAALVATVVIVWIYGERWRPLRRSTWKNDAGGGLAAIPQSQ